MNRLTPLALLLTLLLTPFTAAAAAREPAPELEPNLGWINTDKPLKIADDLKGHCVILYFWASGRIGCRQLIDDIHDMEEKYKGEPLIFIGVHSGRFACDSEPRSVRAAAQELGITHPIVIDNNHAIWTQYDVMTWPTICVIETAGQVIGLGTGDNLREILDFHIKKTLDRGRGNGTIAEKRIELKPGPQAPARGLAFPGKVLAVAPQPGKSGPLAQGRLFISDSAHNRVIVATFPDADGRCELLSIIGDGAAGFADGNDKAAKFKGPQGLAFDPDARTIYIADTGNNAVRAADLDSQMVSTILGSGERGKDLNGGGLGRDQPINAPWDLAFHGEEARILYIAMAGTHQIWAADLQKRTASALAGTGREGLTDGAGPQASLAQPTGLALSADRTRLYFADSESSSIRVLDLQRGGVETIIGAGLFESGDIDGPHTTARLQHCMGVATLATPAGERLLVADTFNHKIKLIDPAPRAATAWAGAPQREGGGGEVGGDPTKGDALEEPGGLSIAMGRAFIADTNHHRIVMIDTATRQWKEITISGLDAEPKK